MTGIEKTEYELIQNTFVFSGASEEVLKAALLDLQQAQEQKRSP